MIRETKPKKAKYAFEIAMSRDMLDYAPAFAAMAGVLAGVPEQDKETNGTYWTEYKNGAGTYTLTIYVNDARVAINLREAMFVKQEIKPEKPPVAEYAVGASVVIYRPGNTYDTYCAWPEIDKVPHFEYGNVARAGHIGTITHIGKHEFESEPILYVIDGRFIVGPRALEPLED